MEYIDWPRLVDAEGIGFIRQMQKNSEPNVGFSRDATSMWCRDCHKEVNALADSSGMTCPLCFRTLAPASGRPLDAIRHAREILERWQSSDLFERITSTGPLTAARQQDRSPLLNIPLNQSASRPLLRSTSEALPVEPAHGHDANAPGIAPTSVPGVFRVPRKSAGGSANDAVKLRSIEIKSTSNEGDDQIAVAEVPVDMASDPMPAQKDIEPSRSQVHIDMPAVSDHAAQHSGTVDLESLFTPLLAAAAPPLDEETAFETPANHKPLETNTLKSELAVEPFAEAQPVEHVVPDQVPEHAEIPSTQSNTPSQQLAESLEHFVQPLSPLPMASASIHHESGDAVDESAESAKQSDSDPTKKKQRAPLRRPPLHRRFQLDRPDPVPSPVDPSAGTEVMNRKFRVDQPGGAADASAAQSQESLTSSVAPETKIVSNSAAGGRRLRIDTAESVDEIASTTGRRSRTQGRARDRYIDEAHESAMRGPHFEINAPKRSNLTSMTGQFLAYMGVLGLTIGTAMVIYGHFGGYAEYTPTGWLVTTVAQMLLFLGVINLVSGGIEQNNEDVSRRINTLGDQLLRIEQVTSEVLRGPKISARLYDNPESEEAASTRETIGAERE